MKKLFILLFLSTLSIVAKAQSAPISKFVVYSIYDHTGRLYFVGLPISARINTWAPGLYLYTTSDNRRGKLSIQPK